MCAVGAPFCPSACLKDCKPEVGKGSTRRGESVWKQRDAGRTSREKGTSAAGNYSVGFMSKKKAGEDFAQV